MKNRFILVFLREPFVHFEQLEQRQMLSVVPPTVLLAKPVNPVALEITWQRPTSSTTIEIQRKSEVGSWEDLPGKQVFSGRFTDTNRKAGTTYEYRLRTVRRGEASSYVHVNVAMPAYDTGVNPATIPAPALPPAGAKTLNITSYGATSNNSSNDDSTAINNAMSAAKAGDTVYIPAGVFHLKSDNIIIKSGVTVAGASAASSKLYATFGTAADQYVFRLNSGTTDVTVKNLSVFCSSGNVYASALLMGSSTITATPVNRIRVTGLRVEGFDKWAINVRNGQNVQIDNNQILNAAKTGGGGEGYGVVLNYDNTQRCWVHHNTIGSPDAGNYQIRHAVLIQYRAHHNLVEHNTSYNNVYDHYDLHGEDEYSNEIRYNYASGSLSGTGIGIGNTGGTAHYDSGPNNWIHHNEVTGCEFGLEVINESDIQFIEDNNFHDNRLAGIKSYTNGADFLYLLRNTITNSTRGIWLDASRNNWIEANQLRNNTGYGILTTASVTNYTIINNLFSGNGIAWSLGSGFGVFHSNVIAPEAGPILGEWEGLSLRPLPLDLRSIPPEILQIIETA